MYLSINPMNSGDDAAMLTMQLTEEGLVAITIEEIGEEKSAAVTAFLTVEEARVISRELEVWYQEMDKACKLAEWREQHRQHRSGSKKKQSK